MDLHRKDDSPSMVSREAAIKGGICTEVERHWKLHKDILYKVMFIKPVATREQYPAKKSRKEDDERHLDPEAQVDNVTSWQKPTIVISGDVIDFLHSCNDTQGGLQTHTNASCQDIQRITRCLFPSLPQPRFPTASSPLGACCGSTPNLSSG
ncbi:hypothetical protein PAMA_002025 [Pampus argenteus]